MLAVLLAPERIAAARIAATLTRPKKRVMSHYTARIIWKRDDGAVFTDKRYSRAHVWKFDGGLEVPASSSPHVVPLPYSNANNVDPEEAFLAAISSCHMLTFLFLAAKAGLRIDSYEDSASAVMGKNAAGRMAVTEATLQPHIVFSGEKAPTDSDLEQLHHAAHNECFIANAVLTRIDVKGTWKHVGG